MRRRTAYVKTAKQSEQLPKNPLTHEETKDKIEVKPEKQKRKPRQKT